MTYDVTVTGADGKAENFRVELLSGGAADGPLRCRVNGEAIELDVAAAGDRSLSFLFAGRSFELRKDVAAGETRIVLGEHSFTAEVSDPRSLRSRRRRGDSGDGPRKVIAPMPGKLVRILAPEGTAVEAGQGIVVIEAMKMQNEMKSPKKGVVKKLLAGEGATVNAGEALAIIE